MVTEEEEERKVRDGRMKERAQGCTEQRWRRG
jgi:hypothetical protein